MRHVRRSGPDCLAAFRVAWRAMSNLRLPPILLAILVSAPAVLAGRLAATGESSRAVYLAVLEVFVILIAAAIAAQRRLD